jgi:excisionase family DNA binding protein
MIRNPIINDIKDLVKEAVDEQLLRYTWYDVDGACAYAKCSRTTIFEAIKDGRLKSSKPEGVKSVKIRKDWLDRWLSN